MCDQTLEYFLSLGQIKKRDAADVSWSHAVNSGSRLAEALSGESMSSAVFRLLHTDVKQVCKVKIVSRVVRKSV